MSGCSEALGLSCMLGETGDPLSSNVVGMDTTDWTAFQSCHHPGTKYGSIGHSFGLSREGREGCMIRRMYQLKVLLMPQEEV